MVPKLSDSISSLLNWPNDEQLNLLLKSIDMPFAVERLLSSELVNFIENLKSWYPAIQIGSESRHLEQEFYLKECQLGEPGGGTEVIHRDFLPLKVLNEPSGQCIGFINFQWCRRSMTLSSPMGVVDPKYRGKGVAYLGPKLLEALGRRLDVEMLYYYATLENIAQQKVAESLGYQIMGFMPSWDLDLVEGSPMRVTECIYTKQLPSTHPLKKPQKSNLTETTLALYEKLVGEVD